MVTGVFCKSRTKISKMPPIMNEDFIEDFNKNKPNKDFFDVCKKAGKLIDIKSIGKVEKN